MFFINLKSHNMLKVTLSTDLNSLIDLPKERKELLAIVPGGGTAGATYTPPLAVSATAGLQEYARTVQ